MSKRMVSFATGCIAGAVGSYLLLLAIVSQDVGRSEEAGTGAPRSGFESGAGERRVEMASTPQSVGLDRAEVMTLAERDPRSALRTAATLTDSGERRRAVMLVGRTWAWTDPRAALAQASTLPDAIRADYRESVTAEWANLDAESFLAFAENASRPEELIAGLRRSIPGAPARVFEIATRLPNDPSTGRNPIQTAAMQAFSAREPLAAIERLASFPQGRSRDALLSTALTVYARNNPNAALTWLDGRGTASSTERRAVVRGVAVADFDRGYALAAEESAAIDALLADAIVRDFEATVQVARKLLEHGTRHAEQLLESIVGTWTRRDPEGVVDWLVENANELGSPVTAAVGRALATMDFEIAVSHLDRLPAPVASAWISQIAGPYAQHDAIGALDWVARYQGLPAYQDAHSQIVMTAADSHPELVATMIESFTPGLQAAAAPRIASAWASQDRAAALEWALGLEGPAAESDAVGAVVASWARNDPGASAAWAMSLPRGDARDRTLFAVITNGFIADPRALLDAIDSEAMRRSAELRAVRAADPEIARELLETMLDDPEVGEWARDSLELLGAQGR